MNEQEQQSQASRIDAALLPIGAYGLAANRHVVETLVRYSYEQGLASRTVPLDELYVPIQA